MKKTLLIIIILSLIFISNTGNAIESQTTIAGTIRNSGQGWVVIKDREHIPIGITSVKATNDRIILGHDIGAKIVHTFIVTPDETMIKEGYTVGISGGISYSHIYIYDKNHNLVNPNNYKNAGGNIWVYGLMSY